VRSKGFRKGGFSTVVLLLALVLAVLCLTFLFGQRVLGKVLLNWGNACLLRNVSIESASFGAPSAVMRGAVSCLPALETSQRLGIVAANRGLGLAKWSADQSDAAITAWLRLLQEEPSERLTHFWVGQALLPSDRAEGVLHLRAAEAGRYFLHQARMGAEEDIAELVELALEVGGEQEAAFYLYAAALEMQADPESAVDLLAQQRQLDADGGNRIRGVKLPDQYLALGMAHYRLHNWDEAVAALEEGLLARGEDSKGDFHYWLALAVWKRDGEKSLDEVIDNLKVALEQRPGHQREEVLWAIGDVYRSAGDNSQAAHWYELLVQESPNSYGFYMDLAKVYMRASNLSRAVEVLQIATDRWPEKERSRFLLADAYHDMGEQEEACRQFRQALESLDSDLDTYEYPSEVNFSLVELCDVGE
jgi:tetratricopeptide (TPR) repeat protein